ncbi:hypothetical protein, partial [Sphingomonas sp. CFBP 8760]|uniref:hypothetical protein n=1 Tax=Sphingomonas sp. CFBP 8760 TaxID=2775282 RepID=UPI001A91B9A0
WTGSYQTRTINRRDQTSNEEDEAGNLVRKSYKIDLSNIDILFAKNSGVYKIAKVLLDNIDKIYEEVSHRVSSRKSFSIGLF